MTYSQAEEALVKMGVPRDTAKDFLGWVKENTPVLKAFERRAMEAIHLGKQVNAKGLLEDIRRNEVLASGAEYKVNNSYGSYLARLFVCRYPQHRERFEFRNVTGLRRAA